MASVCNVQFRVVSGHELPKTDLFSQIDPYVVVRFNGELVGRSRAFDNTPNPLWEEDFFFEAEEDDGGLYGEVTVELFDEEVTVDEHVGTCTLDLQSLAPDALFEPLEVPVVFRSDKRGQKFAKAARNARLCLQVVGLGKAFSTYAAEFAEYEETGYDPEEWPGALVDEASSTFLLPVPDTEEGVWAGMRFGPRGTHLLLVTTFDPREAEGAGGGGGGVSYEVAYSGGPGLRVERLVYRKPVKLLGLKVWTELRAVNVPLDAKLSKIKVVERERRLVDNLDPAEALAEANFMIGMPWTAAVKELSKRPGVAVDTSPGAQHIWIPMDSNQPQPAQLLQLDYGPGADRAHITDVTGVGGALGSFRHTAGGGGGGKGPVGKLTAQEAQKLRQTGSFSHAKHPALRVATTSLDLNKGYELGFFGGGGRGAALPMVSSSEVWRRPQPAMGGQFQVVHVLELKDAFLGDTLNEVGLGVYELMRPLRSWRWSKLVGGPPPPPLEEEEEAPPPPAPTEKARQAAASAMRGLSDYLASLFTPCFGPAGDEERRAAAYAYNEEGSGGGGGGGGRGRGGGGGRGGKGYAGDEMEDEAGGFYGSGASGGGKGGGRGGGGGIRAGRGAGSPGGAGGGARTQSVASSSVASAGTSRMVGRYNGKGAIGGVSGKSAAGGGSMGRSSGKFGQPATATALTRKLSKSRTWDKG
ncbi:hypothetical protein HYH02_002539 [Chlamydomonas schloesseri]|uniref:C2 domain-containing protein n=1 Tax=Chlamydomonas schloesseri TaxID=2026947 RepID=A0A836BB34_9CHLO|nr:hypothetical protein HYH02_002539 [Chlamydomonas schloesseri]|eukprot:KAG2453216.1 hypothetical protein HYH02_002539 [Chlamydomonas schloesseri]